MSGTDEGAARAAAAGKPRVVQLKPTNKGGPVRVAAAAPNLGASSSATSSTSAQRGAGGPAVAPARSGPRIVTGQGGGSAILVNPCQRGNPIIPYVRNVGWEYADIVPDYQVGVASCVLFLSLRYHRLHPEYIHTRIQKLGQMFTLRILLIMCDVDDHQSAIKELTKVALVNNLTIIIAWNAEEAGRYLETYKAFEHKPPDLIKERVSDDYFSHLNGALTSIRGVNRTDVITLASNFGSFARIAQATPDELRFCPGFGDVKIRRLYDAFHQPFRMGPEGSRSRAERRRDALLARGVQGDGGERDGDAGDGVRDGGGAASGANPQAGTTSATTTAKRRRVEATSPTAEGAVVTEEGDAHDAPAAGPTGTGQDDARGRTAAEMPPELEGFDDLDEEEQLRIALAMSEEVDLSAES